MLGRQTVLLDVCNQHQIFTPLNRLYIRLSFWAPSSRGFGPWRLSTSSPPPYWTRPPPPAELDCTEAELVRLQVAMLRWKLDMGVLGPGKCLREPRLQKVERDRRCQLGAASLATLALISPPASAISVDCDAAEQRRIGYVREMRCFMDYVKI
ncbi:hypothetical protein BX600DRAFT_508559 [Xylariales sp. PMI_506]|nr:hypothetical protein BX600DRAFT_508559 [Xylariales sp. PMI_506]